MSYYFFVIWNYISYTKHVYRLQVSAPALLNAMTTNTWSFQLLSSSLLITYLLFQKSSSGNHKKTKMALFKRPCLYSKMNKEDPEEVLSRRAKFLIYKTLQEADVISRRDPRSSFLQLKLHLLKIKIGKKLTKLRRSVVYAVRFGGIRKHSHNGVRALKKLFQGGATSGLPRPIFTLEVWFLFIFLVLCIFFFCFWSFCWSLLQKFIKKCKMKRSWVLYFH